MTLSRRELQPMTQSSHNLRVCLANPLYLPPPRHLCSGPLTALPVPTPPPCFSRLGSAVRMETDDLPGASTLAFHVPALQPPGHVFRFFSLRCVVSSAPWPSCLSLHFSSGTFPGVGEEVPPLSARSEHGLLAGSQLPCTWHCCNCVFISRLG